MVFMVGAMFCVNFVDYFLIAPLVWGGCSICLFLLFALF